MQRRAKVFMNNRSQAVRLPKEFQFSSELATRLTALGYEIERGTSGQPEIRGYTAAYLDASSPGRQQIEAHLA